MIWLQQKREELGAKLRATALSWWIDFKHSLCASIASLTGANLTKLGRKALAPELLSATAVSSGAAVDLDGTGMRAHGLWGGAWGDGVREASLREAFQGNRHACESNYWATSTAPAETLWQLVTNLADLSSWHPLITATNAPRGQRATPGLIYRAVMRYLPISTQIFVERVLPGELLSVRLFPLPGLQERVTYRIVSTLCGTCVLYSITLSGWLSPLAWPVVKPHTTKVAAALVEAAEQHMLGISKKTGQTDIFGAPI